MARLPLAPPALPGEALSSWIARIAARYDISGDELVRYLLPDERSLGGIARLIDERADPQLEAALTDAAGQPGMDFAAQRCPGVAANPTAAWPRRTPAWCPVCAFEDVAARGEVYARRRWGVGASLICVAHGCLLVSECPRCLDRIGYRPVNGRLRLWCDRCEGVADTALEPRRMPFWPFGLPQQHRRCRTVSLLGNGQGFAAPCPASPAFEPHGKTHPRGLDAAAEGGRGHGDAAPALLRHAGPALGRCGPAAADPRRERRHLAAARRMDARIAIPVHRRPRTAGLGDLSRRGERPASGRRDLGSALRCVTARKPRSPARRCLGISAPPTRP